MLPLLSAKGYPSGGTGVILPYVNSSADTRVTISGWTQFAGGSPLAQTSTAASTLTFADTNLSTVVDVWYLDIGGAFTYSIDGGAAVTITPPGGTNVAPRKTTITGLSNTTHTVVLTSSTATATYVMGVAFHQATGVVFNNLGYGGASTPSTLYRAVTGHGFDMEVLAFT